MTRQEILPRSGLMPTPQHPSRSCGKAAIKKVARGGRKRARVGDSSPIGGDDVDIVVVEALGGGKIKGGG